MINLLQKNGNFNMQKLVSVISICTYLFIYAIAFNAFEFEGQFPGDWWDNRWDYMLVMASVGGSFIAALIGYVFLNNYNRIKVNVVNLISGLVQIIVLYYAGMVTRDVRGCAISYEDGALEWRCDFILVMLVVVGIIAILQAIIAIANIIIVSKTKEVIVDRDNSYCNSYFYYHGAVLCVFMSSVIASYFYFWSLLGVLLVAPLFLLAFGIPASILLVKVVNDWIRQKKYTFAIGGYLLYMYLVYGAVYRSVPGMKHGIYSKYEPGNVFFEYVLEWINIAVAAVAVIKLIMMAMRDKKDISN